MRLLVIAMATLCLVAGATHHARAAVGCTLENPQDDLARFFPEFSDFSFQTLSFAVQDPTAHQELGRRLGGTLDPVYESADVPYALYTVRRNGEHLGHAFGVNQRGTFSNIQVVVALGPAGDLRQVYLQKLRSPEHAALSSAGFTESLAAIPLADYPSFTACFTHGQCNDVPVADPTGGRQVDDYRAILRALAKLHHVSTLLLRPGRPPSVRDARALAERLESLWIPEQGFTPLDAPRKISVHEAEEHIVDADALVAVLPTHDQVYIYPVSLLTTHPVIQDTLDGRQVTIAWSSPSHTLSVLESQGEPTLSFSHSLNLLFGHQTMLERRSRAEWSPVLGRVVQGQEKRARLPHVPGPSVLPWSLARGLYPAASVAVPSDPYSKHKAFYRAHRARFHTPSDGRRVLALSIEGQRFVIRKETLAVDPFYQTTLGGTPVLVVSDAGGRAVYDTRLQGQALRFDLHIRDTETGAGLLRDRDTGSVWEALSGRAIAGPRAGAQLRPIVYHEMPEAGAQALFPERG